MSKEIKKELGLYAPGNAFESSMQEKAIPNYSLEAETVTLFKRGRKYMPGNYRPVNLTVTSMKVMESIVKDHLVEHLERHGLIGSSQH